MRISDWSSDVCSSDLGNDRERAASGQPGISIQVFLRHGLLNEKHLPLAQPMDHFQRQIAIFPTLICVHTQGNGSFGTNYLHDLFIVIAAQLYLNHPESICFPYFLTDHFRRVNSNRSEEHTSELQSL